MSELDHTAYWSGYNNTANAMQRRRTNALDEQQLAARVRAGNALEGGDYQGAAGELYGVGDLTGGMQVQSTITDQQNAARTQEQADQTRARTETVRALTAHRRLPAGPSRAQGLPELAASLTAVGAPPAVLAALNDGDITDQDLDAAIEALGGDPNEGAYTLGRTRFDRYGGTLATVPEDQSVIDERSARTDYYRAGIPLRGAQTERALRPPAGRSGGGGRSRGGRGRGGGGSAATPHTRDLGTGDTPDWGT